LAEFSLGAFSLGKFSLGKKCRGFAGAMSAGSKSIELVIMPKERRAT